MYGGKPEMAEPLQPFKTVDVIEAYAAYHAVYWRPLSGFLAGNPKGGAAVQELENNWQKAFGIKHAIAVNSATSGLLAASAAVGLERGDRFLTTPYTMSATAAAPMLLGARPVFGDVEDNTFCLAPRMLPAFLPPVQGNLRNQPVRASGSLTAMAHSGQECGGLPDRG